MKRIHTHGLNKRRRELGAAGAPGDQPVIAISCDARNPENECDYRCTGSDKIIT
ncbi:hypothetical protein [Paraburkholderia sediminicola]|uniref:hypothetical protein n=1 Tax=Paraburkholderia sediminicola TaxID=458836 RepID=UPI0038BC8225